MVIMEQLKSSKQEKFSRLIALDGLSISEAYKQSYNCENMKQDSIYQLSSRLSKQVQITSRIEALKADISDKLASEVVWDKARIVSELGINVDLGRETKQLAASNQALNLIGKAVGSVFEPDSVLQALAAMGPSEPESLVSDTGTIEATSYQLLDEPE